MRCRIADQQKVEKQGRDDKTISSPWASSHPTVSLEVIRDTNK